VSQTPIEYYLDELLRRSSANASTTRRLLNEASDHLYVAAAELQAGGLSSRQAEVPAVRRFGSVSPIMRAATRGSFRALVWRRYVRRCC